MATSWLHHARRLARRLGLEVHRHNTAQSPEARLRAMWAHHGVDGVIDVGANDGGYGRELRQSGYRGPIVSFEPGAEAHTSLTRYASDDAHWHVMPRCALGRSAAELRLNLAANSVSSSLLIMLPAHLAAAPASATQGSEVVPVWPLDALVLPVAATRWLLKIDTQGFELQVLEGAQRTLSQCVGVQVELSLLPLYAGQPLFDEVLKWLAQRGFALWSVLPGFVDERSGRMLQMDGLFFRDHPLTGER